MNSSFFPRRLAVLTGIILLVGSMVGSGWVLNHAEEQDRGSSPTQPPAAKSQGFPCIGYVDVEGSVASLSPLQPGRVEWVVTEGKVVKKGDVLLRLDRHPAEFQKEQAASALQVAKEALTRAKLGPQQHTNAIAEQEAAVEAAKVDKESMDKLLELAVKKFNKTLIDVQEKDIAENKVQKMSQLVAAEEKKLANLKLQDPQISIREAEAMVNAKKAKLEEAEWVLKECDVVAPADGLVLRVQVSPGEVLGSQSRQPAIQFVPEGPRIIRAEVLQEFAGHVKEGQEATIEDGTRASGPRWTGKVKRISPWFTHRRNIMVEPFQYNDVRTLECLVEVTPGGEPLRINQRVRVTFKPGT